MEFIAENGIPTLCKGLQSNQSASPYHPRKQTNKVNGRLDEESLDMKEILINMFSTYSFILIDCSLYLTFHLSINLSLNLSFI